MRSALEISYSDQAALHQAAAVSATSPGPVRDDMMKFPRLRPRRHIVCQQAVELVTGYLEGAPVAVGRRFEAHLGGCPHCAEYLAQIRKTIELTRSLTPDDSLMPGDLTLQMQDEFIAICRHWRADQDG